MILLIGSVIAIVGVLVLFLSGSLADTSYGVKAEAVAQAAATAGAEDAMLQLARNSISTFPATYSIPVGSTTATVNVNVDTPSAGFITVTSTAIFSNHKKVLRVVLSEDSNTTQVSVVSWQNIQ
ncbi:MAG: hypothetical protein P4L99_07910 [Chthoniobacter sp.]|nr:hypothetical protein [Chthoniobacter sp.]